MASVPCAVAVPAPVTDTNMATANFDTLLKGGDSGPIIDREVPEKSLLLTKLLGTGPGRRMPLNRPPLSDALINKFQTWIREGATFDGAWVDGKTLIVSAGPGTGHRIHRVVLDGRDILKRDDFVGPVEKVDQSRARKDVTEADERGPNVWVIHLCRPKPGENLPWVDRAEIVVGKLDSDLEAVVFGHGSRTVVDQSLAGKSGDIATIVEGLEVE